MNVEKYFIDFKGIRKGALQTVDKTLLVSTPEAFFLFSVQKVCT